MLLPQLNEILRGDFGGKTHNPEVAGMDLEKQSRLGADGFLVIIEVGTVGCSNLSEESPAPFHHIGDSKCSTNFYQLSSRNDHLLALCKGIQNKQDSACIIIHHQGRFGTR